MFDPETVTNDDLDIDIWKDRIIARRRLVPLPEVPSQLEGSHHDPKTPASTASDETVETFIRGCFYADIKVDTVRWTVEPLKPSLITGIIHGAMPIRSHESDDGEWSSEAGSSFAMVSTPDIVSEEEEIPVVEAGPRETTDVDETRPGPTVQTTTLPRQRLSGIKSGSPSRPEKHMLFVLTFEKEIPAIWPRLVQAKIETAGPQNLRLDGTSWTCLGEHYLDDEANIMESVKPLLFASLQPYRHLVAQSRLLCDTFQIGAMTLAAEDLAAQSRTIACQVLDTYYRAPRVTADLLMTILALDVASTYGRASCSLPVPPSSAHTQDSKRFTRKLLTRVHSQMRKNSIHMDDLKNAVQELGFNDSNCLEILDRNLEPIDWTESDPSLIPLLSPESLDHSRRLSGSALLAASNASSQDPLIETRTDFERRQVLRRRRRRRKEQEKDREDLRKRLLGKGDDASRHTRLIYVLAGISVLIMGWAVWRKKRRS